MAKQAKSKAKEQATPNFAEYFAPDAARFVSFFVLLCAAIIPLFVFAFLVHVRMAYVLNALFDPKSLIAIAATYVFTCFSIVRRIPLWQSFLAVFVPELIVIFIIASKYGVAG